MASHPRHHPFPSLHLFLFFLFIGRCVEAQSHSNETTNIPSNNDPNSPSKFNPSMAIIIVLLISVFFFLGFFSIYIRQCGGDRDDRFATAGIATAGNGRVRIQKGLDPDVLEKLPTLVYSEVKEHKIGKGALECAICLNEFEDDETIRLLPECDHVFHLDCIDAWLASRVTCPVCRANYTRYSPDGAAGAPGGGDGTILPPAEPEVAPPPGARPAHPVAVPADDMDERKEEIRELARIASRVRGTGPRKSKRLSRSHSTGHSMMRQGEASLDRYTLRLPENLRKEIIAAGKMQRARTFAVTVNVGGAGEASTRKVSRGVEEGSSRRGRTIHLGRSDRWPSFFGRSLSGRISMKRKLSGIKASANRRSGGGGGSVGSGEEHPDEATTAGLNRV